MVPMYDIPTSAPTIRGLQALGASITAVSRFEEVASHSHQCPQYNIAGLLASILPVLSSRMEDCVATTAQPNKCVYERDGDDAGCME